MAPGIVTPMNGSTNSAYYLGLRSGSRQVSGVSAMFESTESISVSGRQSRRETSQLQDAIATGGSGIANVVQSLYRQSGNELGTVHSWALMNTSCHSIMDWIRNERLSHLPAEGSDYDKVLSWAQLFIERLHLFDSNVQKFAGDSHLAAQLSYGHCATLLELGKPNAEALMVSFGFMLNTSSVLVNLLERTELFSVSSEIKEQLILALTDLVTLVARVSTHFHQAIRGRGKASISVNIYETFSIEIQSFKSRCADIAGTMWRHQLAHEGLDIDQFSTVQSVRSWLAPEDHLLNHLAENSSHLAHEREALTCLWIGPHLARFLKSDDRTLSFYGKPGSGKTVLASVIVDRLQHQVAGLTYPTLFVPINARVPVETTVIAIVKTILYQLLDKRIGNVELLQILADGLESTRTATDVAEYEEILWKTLERSLAAALAGAKKLVIVVDGLDEAICGESDLFKKLVSATTAGTNIKLITFGADKTKHTDRISHVHVDEDRIHEDIATVVRSNFEHSKFYLQMPELEQELLVDQVTSASKGSFQWAKLATKRLRHEHSVEAIQELVESFAKKNPTIYDLVSHTLSGSDVDEDSKLMLSWLVTADRPLQLEELSTLAAIQVDKQTVGDRKVDPLHILKPLASLVFLQDGRVSIRHALIRQAIVDSFAKGKLLPSVKDRHAEFAGRLFVYIKSIVQDRHQVSLQTHLAQDEVTQLVHNKPLLQFAIRYWPYHVMQSKSYVSGGDKSAAKDFGKLFPASHTLLLLQSSLWQNISTPTLLSYQKLTTGICRHSLPKASTVVLQSLILLAALFQTVSHSTDALTLVYEVAALSNALLSTTHTITQQMVTLFVELSQGHTTSSKTDIMVWREEMLLILVEIYKVQYGVTSEKVVSILRILTEYYEVTQQTSKLEKIKVQITDLTGSSTVTATETEHHADLSVQLQAHEEEKKVEREQFVLDIEQDNEIVDASNTEALVKSAITSSVSGQVVQAERLYIDAWQYSCKISRSEYSERSEAMKLKSLLAYVNFLISQKRKTDVSIILSSVYEEYRHDSSIITKSTYEHLQAIAQLMLDLDMKKPALALFKRLAAYLESINRKNDSYKIIQQHITQVTHQVIETVGPSSPEQTLLDVLYGSAEYSKNWFSAGQTLVNIYMAEHRWKEAAVIIKRVMTIMWPSYLEDAIKDVRLPKEHLNECFGLVKIHALCHRYRNKRAKEEEVRERIYVAFREDKPVNDGLRETATSEYLDFLRRTSNVDKEIKLRQGTLDAYRAHYGKHHDLVIKTLWRLAELTRHRPVVVEYYQQIIEYLNKDNKQKDHCHPDAIVPAIVVATQLWKQNLFSDALKYYSLIFNTWIHDVTIFTKFKQERFVQKLYTRYLQCLRSTNTEVSVIYKVTSAYQAQVKKLFSMTASITIQATLTLATICRETKIYEKEAIALYEQLAEIKSTEIDHDEISAVLGGVRRQETAVARSRSTTMTTTQIEQVTTALAKRAASAREEFGWAHEESLVQTKELVQFYFEHQSVEIAIRVLKETLIKVLQSNASSFELVTAASTIGQSFLSGDQIVKLTEFSRELYRQIVRKDASRVKEFGFDFTDKGREVLVFVAQLEHFTRQQNASVSEIVASLTHEYLGIENLQKELKSKTSTLESVTQAVSRAYQYALSKNQTKFADEILAKYTSYFISTDGKRAKLTDAKEVKILLVTLLGHFKTHTSTNFDRSIKIAANNGVRQLLAEQKYTEAAQLANVASKYISADKAYHTADVVKYAFNLGLTIAGHNLAPKPDAATLTKLHNVAAAIIQSALRVVIDLNLSITELGLDTLNIIIGLLGKQNDYKNLVWVLSSLWESRDLKATWSPAVTIQIVRRYIVARFMSGDILKATRLAENIVYNCRRVNGALHPSTLDISTLLAQLYTSIAQRYRSKKGGEHMASKYYKKAAAVHETILRVFVDPSFTEFEGGAENGASSDSVSHELDLTAGINGTSDAGVSDGEHVRQHFHLLKLALQRLGEWPKDHSEYQRLSEDLFVKFGSDLKSTEGVDKWDFKKFGNGKASSDEDGLHADLFTWNMDIAQPMEVESEL